MKRIQKNPSGNETYKCQHEFVSLPFRLFTTQQRKKTIVILFYCLFQEHPLTDFTIAIDGKRE